MRAIFPANVIPLWSVRHEGTKRSAFCLLQTQNSVHVVKQFTEQKLTKPTAESKTCLLEQCLKLADETSVWCEQNRVRTVPWEEYFFASQLSRYQFQTRLLTTAASQPEEGCDSKGEQLQIGRRGGGGNPRPKRTKLKKPLQWKNHASAPNKLM